ncbi:MAG: 50S ribosomal protein L13 [Candidatus Marinimicrobia bacterium]|nr:50S ribosomal protein L13 [Candidatus Neomarinimicrobiota bacterium]
MKTYSPKASEIEHKWFVVDAENKVLGRLASEIAHILRGKHKPTFAPHMDVGDFVVVVNAEKVRLTGRKTEYKTYFRHSGYPGGQKFTTVAEMLEKFPERVIVSAVKGMLPSNKLANKQIKKLKVYAGEDHPHESQSPEILEI